MIIHHKRKLRTVIFVVFFFTLGFLTHALFFPYVLTDSLSLMMQGKTRQDRPQEVPQEQNQALTKVYYVDGEFSPRVVKIKKSYYISIINNSDKELMWLISDNALFNTPRGYGKSEEVHTILYDEGTYEVTSKLHPQNKLIVIVRP